MEHDNGNKFIRKHTFKVNKSLGIFYPRKLNSDEENDSETIDSSDNNISNIIEGYEYDKVDRDGMLKALPVESPNIKEAVEEEIDEQTQAGDYNIRALSKYATTYELEKFEKNILIIFNQVNVEGYSKPRFGTEKDVKALTSTFHNFGFDYVVHNDFTKEELFRELKTCK